MRLIDLNPQWIVKDGRRIGFDFDSPANSKWRQSCFAEKTPTKEQCAIFKDRYVQFCRADFAWTIKGGIQAATFETMSVTPSLDGSAGGLWHGFITDGEIR